MIEIAAIREITLRFVVFCLSSLRTGLIAVVSLVLWTILSNPVWAQDTLNQVGVPIFTTEVPVELGFVNVSNGNLHSQVPLASFSQRGSQALMTALVYDSRIWQVVGTTWQPTNVSNSWGGWRFITNAAGGTFLGKTAVYFKCNYIGEGGRIYSYYYYYYYNYRWAGPDGSVRTFPIFTQNDTRGYCGGVQSSGDASANDSSGLHMYVTGFSNATVRAPDGSQIFPSYKDTNGNFFSADSNGNTVDTLGRTPLTVTSNCNGNPNQICYNILNSQGNTAVVTVTTTSIPVSTAFGQTGVTEYSGAISVIQSIKLPDNTSYQFSYDSYGELNSITFPTSGQATYGYSNFQDSFGNRNRWLTSRTSGGGTWSYTPAVITTCGSGTVGCQQKVTVLKPSGDNLVYTFTLNNGAWANQIQYYTGAISSNNLIATLTRTWDFSHPCTPTPCIGNNNIQKLNETVVLPVGAGSTVSKTTQYAYDSIWDMNVISMKEWKYYSGSQPATPDRETDITYLNASGYLSENILNRPLSMTVKDGGGSQIALTNYSYDAGTLASVTGATHHDDAGYGTSNTLRGNPTNIQRWVGTTNFLSTTFAYDTTGQVVQVTDSAGNSTAFIYGDNFFTDNGANPPQPYAPPAPTNAYLTQTTPPLIGTAYFGYYFNSGKRAYTQDQNNATTYLHYLDLKDRLTHTYYPLVGGNRSWSIINYTSSTQEDSFSAINDTAPSTSCTSCRNDRITNDGLGRVTRRTLVSDPQGPVYIDSTYDSSGRVLTVSNPYRNTTDPTYGLETTAYDGLDRVVRVTHADGNSSQKVYGAGVSGAGGNASQSSTCGAATYGLGFPTLMVDEAGKKRQVWTDGFGRIIEVDEPDPSNNNNLTLATCYSHNLLNNLTNVVQGTQSRSFSFDPLGRMISSTTPENGTTYFYYTKSDGVTACSGEQSAVCRRTDSLNVTTTYVYDQLNRLVSKLYSDGTASVNFYYDQTTYNGMTINNGKGRRTGMSDASGTTAWDYDAAGNVRNEQRTIGGVTRKIAYNYTVNGLLSSLTYPSNRTISYSYNNASQSTSAVDQGNGINYSTNATYAPQGAVLSVLHGQVNGGFGGITESYGYNNRLQMTSIQASSTSGTALSLSYGFSSGSNNGDAATETNNRDPGRTQTWVYDSLNRITSATSQATSGPNCWGLSFGYDRWANYLAARVSQCSAYALSLSVNSNNQITTTGFTYDLAGRMTSDGSNSYSWNAENQIKSAAGITYSYDGDGLRVMKSSGKIYWRDILGQTLAESDLAGNVLNEFIYFAGRRVAWRDSTANVYYYLADQLGSTRVVTLANGAVCYDADFYPYGGELIFTNTCQQNYKFTGYERDGETGLDYAGLRYYSSSTGRFLSPDPIGGSPAFPISLNRYTYVYDNPTNLTDLDGLAPRDQHQYLTFIMAALIGIGSAESLAQGTAYADSFWHKMTGPGLFLNPSWHFGVPCTATQTGCSLGNGDNSDFVFGEKKLHDVEDMGPGGPHDLMGSMSPWGRFWDVIGHIFGPLIGKNPDRNVDKVVQGMARGWTAMEQAYHVDAGPPPMQALKFIVSTLNDHSLELVGTELVFPDGRDLKSGTVPSNGGQATLVDSRFIEGMTVNVWQLPSDPSFYDSPGIQAILFQFSLPGSDPVAEGEAIYNYQLQQAGFIFFPGGSWFCDASSGSCGFGGGGSDPAFINIKR
jgi:RHS repeat-associated protein